MAIEYCRQCGKWHEPTTAACPITVPWEWNDQGNQGIEQRLDKIIGLLTEIEYLLRTK